MKKIIALLLIICINFSCETSNENQDIAAIKTVLNEQQEAWSNYELERFMAGYLKSDSLKFYGANGLTYGWQNTLDNYHERYPSKEHTGKLNFTIDEISRIDDESYFVMGQFHLKRTIGDANGVFMVIFKKIDGNWKIIADLSC